MAASYRKAALLSHYGIMLGLKKARDAIEHAGERVSGVVVVTLCAIASLVVAFVALGVALCRS